MKAKFEFDEETLRQEATVTLSPVSEEIVDGKEMPGEGDSEELHIEIRGVPIGQDSEYHQGGSVLKFEDMRLVESLKAFAKSR